MMIQTIVSEVWLGAIYADFPPSGPGLITQDCCPLYPYTEVLSSFLKFSARSNSVELPPILVSPPHHSQKLEVVHCSLRPNCKRFRHTLRLPVHAEDNHTVRQLSPFFLAALKPFPNGQTCLPMSAGLPSQEVPPAKTCRPTIVGTHHHDGPPTFPISKTPSPLLCTHPALLIVTQPPQGQETPVFILAYDIV